MKNPSHWPRKLKFSLPAGIFAALVLFTASYTSAEGPNFDVISSGKPVESAESRLRDPRKPDFSVIAGKRSKIFSGQGLIAAPETDKPDFSVLANWKRSLPAQTVADSVPVLPVFADEPGKPVVLVFGDLKTCPPCKRLDSEWEKLPPAEREKLPFILQHADYRTLVPQPPFIPLLKWTDSAGIDRQFHWPDSKDSPKSLLRDFERRFNDNERSNQAASKKLRKTTAVGRKNHRDQVVNRFRGTQRRHVAASAYNIGLAKLHEDPTISREDLEKHVQGELQQAGLLPPGLLTILWPILEFVITALLQYFRPAAAPEPAAVAFA